MLQAPETFWTLFHDAAHWKFELFVGGVEELVTGVLIGMLLWPRIKKHWQHHLERDKQEAAAKAPAKNVVQREEGPARQGEDYPWSMDIMRIVNELTPEIKGKAFDPGWSLLRQRLERFEESRRLYIELYYSQRRGIDAVGIEATVEELRKHFNDLVDALEAEGICTSRECMCDTAEPVVKLGAAIAELEKE